MQSEVELSIAMPHTSHFTRSMRTFIFFFVTASLLFGCRTNIPLEETKDMLNSHFSVVKLPSPQKVRMTKYVPPGFIVLSDDTVLEGVVTGRIIIGKNGEVTDIQIVGATDQRLSQCYKEAVSQWTFEPVRNYQGELMRYALVQPIRFSDTVWISKQILAFKGMKQEIKPCQTPQGAGDYLSLG